jgi:hypothetical protein
MDALISGLTVACAWWFYPQLKLIGMDDKRIEELRPADHPVAQDADEQKRSLDDKKDGESDQLNSAHAPPIGDAKSTAPSANERTAESTQTFTGPHFTDDEFINRQFDAWESENNDDSFKSQPDYSADKARQAMLDALKRLEELKSDRSSDTEEDNNEPATTAAAAANRQQLDIDPKGYYAYLGLQGRERLATVEEIRIAFRRMARIYHPDLETDLQSKKQAKIKFQKLVQVYSVLRDGKCGVYLFCTDEIIILSQPKNGRRTIRLRNHNQTRNRCCFRYSKTNYILDATAKVLSIWPIRLYIKYVFTLKRTFGVCVVNLLNLPSYWSFYAPTQPSK